MQKSTFPYSFNLVLVLFIVSGVARTVTDMVISLTSPTLEDRVDDGERTVAYSEEIV